MSKIYYKQKKSDANAAVCTSDAAQAEGPAGTPRVNPAVRESDAVAAAGSDATAAVGAGLELNMGGLDPSALGSTEEDTLQEEALEV